MSRRAEAIRVVLGFACLAVLLTWPLAAHVRTRVPGDLGDPLLTAWTLAWDADRLLHGLRGVFDAPNFFPYRHTLLYSDHLLGIALFTAPLQWLSRNPVAVYNAAFLASFVFAAAAMYLLARELTGHAGAAVVAALSFACDPFRISHLAHLQWLMTGWLPLGLWAMHRYFATGRAALLWVSTACYLLQSLTASYFTYFGALPFATVFVAEAWRGRLPRRGVRDLAVAAAFVLIVMAPIAKAYYQVRADYGLRRAPGEIAEQSADVADYFSAPPLDRVWRGMGSGRGEHELFPGAVTMALATIGAVACRRRPAVRTYIALAVLAFLLSLGPAPSAWGRHLGPGPYALLLRIVPGLDGLRAPARLHVVVQLALAALAAFGAMTLADRTGRQAVAAAILGAAIVIEGAAVPIPTAPFDRFGGADRDAYAYLRGLPPGAAIELPTSVDRPDPEFTYQYMTLVHRHPVVNGHSGYLSPLLMFLGGGHSPLNDLDHVGDAVAMLRAIGVRYAVLHRAAFDDADAVAAWARALENRKQVLSVRTFGATDVVAFVPGDPVPFLDDARLQVVPASAI